MKKKIHKALHRFHLLKMPVYPIKKEVKSEIRAIADNYEDFNNLVFEIGCSVLAKAYMKGMIGTYIGYRLEEEWKRERKLQFWWLRKFWSSAKVYKQRMKRYRANRKYRKYQKKYIKIRMESQYRLKQPHIVAARTVVDMTMASQKVENQQ